MTVVRMFIARKNDRYVPKYIVLMYTAGPVPNVKVPMATAQATSNINAISAWHFNGALRQGTSTHEMMPEINPTKTPKMDRAQL